MKTYLGDGLYASFDGYHIRVYANNGLRDTNEVFFDGETLHAFLAFAHQTIAKKEVEG